MSCWKSLIQTAIGLCLSTAAVVSPVAAQCGQWEQGGSLPGTLAQSTVGRINTSTTWDPDGSGPQPPRLVIGGSTFELAGSNFAFNVAMWDGSSWQPIGEGFSSPGVVNSLVVFRGELYAAGEFIVPQPIDNPQTPLAAARNVAKWTGTRWEAVAGGLNDGTPFNATSPAVRKLIVWNDSLYALGQFVNAGGWQPPFTSPDGFPASVPANRIARFDGNVWNPVLVTMGNAQVNGFDSAGVPNDVEIINNQMVIATSHTAIGEETAGATPLQINGVVRYNGTSWLPLNHTNGSPGIGGPAPTAFSIGSIGNDIVVGGNFRTAGGGVVTTNFIGRWNATTGWSAMGAGYSTTVLDLTTYNGQLYACTSIAPIGDSTQLLSRWNNTTSTWENIVFGRNDLAGMFGPGPGIRHLGLFGNQLVIGGSFTTIKDVPMNNIGLFTGTTFTPFGSTGTNGHIQSFAIYNNQLIAAGWFTLIDGTLANRIAAFDGSTWSALGSGLRGSPASNIQPVVYATTIFNGDLIVAGDFVTAGGVTVNRIARWNGSSWSTVGTGAPCNGTIRALAVHNGQLYAGGTFTTIDGVNANRIARFNGTTWQPLVSPGNTFAGGGLPSTVGAMTVFNGDLYIGGAFAAVNGTATSAQRIVRWTGSDWAALGSSQLGGFSSSIPVQAMVEFNGKLIIAGTFTTAGGLQLGASTEDGEVVSYDPVTETFEALGPSLNGIINSALVYRGELLLGGSVGPDFNSDPSLFGGLVRWNANTSTFSQFGDNFFGAPFAMMPFGNSLFVGGHIVAVGPESALIPSPFIARWTGCCGPADIGGEGGAETPDGILDNNDFVVFINLFFSSDAGADLGSEGGAIGSDGSFDNNDFIVFIQFFFEGC